MMGRVISVMHSHKSAPPKCLPSNPGNGSAGSVSFQRGEKSWTERFDLVDLLASALRKKDHVVQREKPWLVHEKSGFTLMPEIVELHPLDEGGVRTTSTIQTNHNVLMPDGIFEYQHSTGDNVEESFRKGFEQWAETDFVALLDALKPRPEICTSLEYKFPPKAGMPAECRRVILGPVTHTIQNPKARVEPLIPEAQGKTQGDHCEDHEFCPCCLLTNSFEAFRELIEDRSAYGIRLFAMRDSNGDPQADCRVNGNDWNKGTEALRRYVGTWPEAGFEMRKQYVFVQTMLKES
jgi:hypothetical protein